MPPARHLPGVLMRAQSDSRLVALSRAGSEPAFAAIVARYERQLLGHCRQLVGAEHAEDAVQEAFIRAHRSLTRGGQVRELRPWLYRVAHNASLNLLRGHLIRHEGASPHVAEPARPDAVAERRETLRETLQAVAGLPWRQRDALVLRELEGRSYQEIAQRLGVGDGAVRALLHRARVTLRAGASALTPDGLLRIGASLGNPPVAARMGEVCGGLGAGALAAKSCAAVVVAGGIALGPVVAATQHVRLRPAPSSPAPAARPGPAGPAQRTHEPGARGFGSTHVPPGGFGRGRGPGPGGRGATRRPASREAGRPRPRPATARPPSNLPAAPAPRPTAAPRAGRPAAGDLSVRAPARNPVRRISAARRD